MSRRVCRFDISKGLYPSPVVCRLRKLCPHEPLHALSEASPNLSVHIIQLRDLQEIRWEEEKREMEKAPDIIEMIESKGDMDDSTADGFVFSDQIMESLRTRNRDRRAEEAYEHRRESAA